MGYKSKTKVEKVNRQRPTEKVVSKEVCEMPKELLAKIEVVEVAKKNG